jgi:hypothetical protein
MRNHHIHSPTRHKITTSKQHDRQPNTRCFKQALFSTQLTTSPRRSIIAQQHNLPTTVATLKHSQSTIPSSQPPPILKRESGLSAGRCNTSPRSEIGFKPPVQRETLTDLYSSIVFPAQYTAIIQFTKQISQQESNTKAFNRASPFKSTSSTSKTPHTENQPRAKDVAKRSACAGAGR